MTLPSATDAIRPFILDVPQRELDDLRRRLDQARWPGRETVDDWRQGVPRAAMRALCDHWRDRSDRRRCEATLNSLGQSRTAIDGPGVHFLHVRSPRCGRFAAFEQPALFAREVRDGFRAITA